MSFPIHEKAHRNPHKYGKRECPIDPSSTEITILEILALKRSSWAKELIDRFNVGASRTVYPALGCLIARGMIEPAGKDVCESEPSAAKRLQLSEYGLIAALYYQKNSEFDKNEAIGPKPIPRTSKKPQMNNLTKWKMPLPTPFAKELKDKTKSMKLKSPTLWRKIDEVVETHKDKLPLILGKWSYFKENKCGDIVLSSLKSFFEKDQTMPYVFYNQGNAHQKIVISTGLAPPIKFEEHVKSLIQRLYCYVLFPEPTHSLDYIFVSGMEPSGWEATLLKDKDIRNFIYNQIKTREKYHKKELRQLNFWMKFDRMIESS
ncbi:MAG: hypothetical protein NWE92_01735 [Candidatus Bathyarchaeota archaeon]|nr:hypothetical protein [Candidatus Bathyarchaeota archaeon]